MGFIVYLGWLKLRWRMLETKLSVNKVIGSQKQGARKRLREGGREGRQFL